MTAVISVSGVDLEGTLGLVTTNLGAYLDAAIGVQSGTEIPGVPGEIVDGPYRTKVREFTVEGYLAGASQAAVRTNLRKLHALLGDPDLLHPITMADWSTVRLYAKCVELPGLNAPFNGSRANSQNEAECAVKMLFRSRNPFWQDITPQSVAFTTSAVAMPQGTAPSYPVLTTTAGAITTPVLTCKDYLGVTLWTCTLASLLAGERYRITTEPGILTIEKFTGGVWVNSDASRTAGVFPKPLPSSGIGYQTSAWPTLQATSGAWTADYPMQWR